MPVAVLVQPNCPACDRYHGSEGVLIACMTLHLGYARAKIRRLENRLNVAYETERTQRVLTEGKV